MAALAAMPPTPQQSFTHIGPAQSPPGPPLPNQPNGMPAYAHGHGHGHGYSISFDSQHGHPVQHMPHQQQPNGQQAMYQQSFANGPVSNPGYARSFGGGESFGPVGAVRGFMEKPQIYTAVYSGVSVYEMDIQGIACMRRRSDGWLNATQILKVAGVDKGKRTKVLEKEILTGEHEKVQGGYGKYQGTWISYRRGREFCRQYGVEDILRPLLDYDVSADGSGGQGGQETPTKEQAMAANRKRFYQPSVDGGRPSQGPVTNGTFFQNISPTTSVALAAMNKAARLNSPAPRPGSAQRPSNMRQMSQQDGVMGSQQSIVSQQSYAGEDSGYGTQPNTLEPPRKRMRRDSDGMAPPALPIDASMQSASPTEPNESFYDGGAPTYPQGEAAAEHNPAEPLALPPLPAPSTAQQHEKHALILDLFADSTRTDFASHPALLKLSGEDLNIPLDNSANSALHWAATLAKIPLLRLLIARGANPWRGNAAGQTALVSAVLVSNCWERGCFPEVLECLGSLIEVRDLQGRTILHHIAVSSGVRGRGRSCKYYLEALLEHLVRIGTGTAEKGGAAPTAVMKGRAGNNDSQGATSQESTAVGSRNTVSLVRFLSHIVNAQDKAGNTALNLVARIGNRSIIQQLLEIHADPALPNYKGVCARDFGVGGEAGPSASQQSVQTVPATQDTVMDVAEGVEGSRPEVMTRDAVESYTAMMTQNLERHQEVLRQRTIRVDELNAQIREFSARQQADLAVFRELKERVTLREGRQARIKNLKKAIQERKAAGAGRLAVKAVDADWLETPAAQDLFTTAEFSAFPDAMSSVLKAAGVPSAHALRARIAAYSTQNTSLQQQADELKGRSAEVEALYRRVVSLCTGVEEERVAEALPGLVAAVESEATGGGGMGEEEGMGDVGRVREFLRRVDGG